MSNDFDDLLVDLACVYRVTRLIVEDNITARPREAIVRALYEDAHRAGEVRRVTGRDRPSFVQYAKTDPTPPKLAKLITCWWCSSAWAAVAVVYGLRRAPRLKRVLAASAITGVVSSLVE